MATKKATPPAPADVELQADEADHDVDPKAAQFPSLAGDPNAEIAQRTADGPAVPGKFVKTFVLDREYDNPEILADGHALAMRQEAAQRGLRPSGDPELVDTTVTRLPRSVTTELTYAMPVTPAATAPANQG